MIKEIFLLMTACTLHASKPSLWVNGLPLETQNSALADPVRKRGVSRLQMCQVEEDLEKKRLEYSAGILSADRQKALKSGDHSLFSEITLVSIGGIEEKGYVFDKVTRLKIRKCTLMNNPDALAALFPNVERLFIFQSEGLDLGFLKLFKKRLHIHTDLPTDQAFWKVLPPGTKFNSTWAP